MLPLILVAKKNQQIQDYLKKIKAEGDIFLIINRQANDFSVNEIKLLIKEANIAHKEKRVYVLPEFHKSSLEAQNALLKITEEPPPNTQFILVVENVNQIIPTLISRAKVIVLTKINLPNPTSETKNLLEKIIKNKELKFTNQNPIVVIDEMLVFFQQRLSTEAESIKIIKEIIKVRRLLETNNINPTLALDHLLIFIKKTYSMKK